jgi:hypothetical protein
MIIISQKMIIIIVTAVETSSLTCLNVSLRAIFLAKPSPQMKTECVPWKHICQHPRPRMHWLRPCVTPRASSYAVKLNCSALKQVSTTPWKLMREWRYSSTILDLCTRWWSTSRTGHFTPGEIAPGIHCIGGWVRRRGGLKVYAGAKIKNLAPVGNTVSVAQPVAYVLYRRLTLSKRKVFDF